METPGTNYNEAISVLKEVILNLSKITEQRKKALEVLKTDQSKSWGDGILVWYNTVKTLPFEQLGINGRYCQTDMKKQSGVAISGTAKYAHT
eukprot:10101187-Ditylum_brightwellii.AAC.1